MRQRCFISNLKLIIVINVLSNCTGIPVMLESINVTTFSFPLRMYFPFKFEEHFWAYPALFLPSCWAFIVSGNLASNVTLLLCGTMTFISNEFKILGLAFERSLEKQDENVQKSLISFTKRHQDLLR